MLTHPFGRVDDDGNVYCVDDGVERHVGQYADVSPEEALQFFVRKYDDLNTSLVLLERRAKGDAHASELSASLESFTKSLDQGVGVGDFAALRKRCAALHETISERASQESVEAQRMREEAIGRRTAIVERIEAIAASDLSKAQWKSIGAEVDSLFAQWQEAQRQDRKFPKATAEELWKRFRAARHSIDNERRKFFSDLDSAAKAAKSVKEGLIAKAEALAPEGADGMVAYRALLEEWKKAPRGNKKLEDSLWDRFKAAGDTLYRAREERVAAEDSEFGANLEVKLAILAEAEQLTQSTDAKAAREQLNLLHKRWDAAGKVPRSSVKDVEERMRKVEQAVKRLEDKVWNSSNPDKQARSEGLAGQIAEKIARLEEEREAAQAAGDAARVSAIDADLATQRGWLEVL